MIQLHKHSSNERDHSVSDHQLLVREMTFNRNNPRFCCNFIQAEVGSAQGGNFYGGFFFHPKFIVPFLNGIFIKVQVQWTVAPITPGLLGDVCQARLLENSGRVWAVEGEPFQPFWHGGELSSIVQRSVSSCSEIYPLWCVAMFIHAPPDLWWGKKSMEKSQIALL